MSLSTDVVDPALPDGTRAGGLYIPPQRLKRLEYDPKSAQFQRQTWEALKKSLNGLINKLTVQNLKTIIPEIFAENLIRGRGVFVKSMMKAQGVSMGFTDVYAAAISVINTKFPMLGELLVHRLISQFRYVCFRTDVAILNNQTRLQAQRQGRLSERHQVCRASNEPKGCARSDFAADPDAAARAADKRFGRGRGGLYEGMRQFPAGHLAKGNQRYL
jgi:hypothetical protein